VWPFGKARQRRSLGERGEKLARRFLKRRGLKILATNYRCPAGEADLIALDRSTRRGGGGETVIFAEVKTRSSEKYTDPQAAVNAEKQRRIKKVARYYLREHDCERMNVRFDVVAIVTRGDEEPDLRYYADAFR